MSYKVVLVGASGLIGSQLLQELISSYAVSDILAITRRPLNIHVPKVRELIIDFDDLEHHGKMITGDIIYSCLGTTRSATPDDILYKKIDLEYPLTIAKLGLRNGVNQFHIVSSIGADAKSVNSYLKIKGQIEGQLMLLGYPSLHIYQPSFLTGNRQEKRVLERIFSRVMRLIDPLLAGPLKKYQSIPAATVAKAMLSQSLKHLKGSFTYPSIQIRKLV